MSKSNSHFASITSKPLFIRVAESIVIHELCHLIEPNHSQKFWDLVYKYCPEYKIYKKWIKENIANYKRYLQENNVYYAKDLLLSSLDLFLLPVEEFINKFEKLKTRLGTDFVDKLGEDSSLIEIMYDN